MDNYKETFQTWNKIASLYEDKFMDLNIYDDTYDIFYDYLKSANAKILEIGCGPGNITKYILAKQPNLSILGIDIAPNMIELAKKNNPNANFRLMDSRNIHELGIQFDAIICGFCLPYLSSSDRTSLLLNCKNNISEEGILYLSFVPGEYNKSGYQTGSGGDRIYFYYHELENVKRDLVEAEFELLNLINVKYKKGESDTEIHAIIIAKRKKQLFS